MNWVEARGNCTIATTFQALRERVQSDVHAFNSLEEADRECVFGDEGRGRDAFWVRRTGGGTVRFQANHRRIVVAGCAEDDAFSVTLQWDDDANTCRLLVDDESLELWQISRKALSPFFFD